jgi:protocatechuate 3,4-dioxygenase beta subunit
VQRTDDRGVAEFHTIYPGWYYDRAVHIHLKVHIAGHEAFTGELFLLLTWYGHVVDQAKWDQLPATTQDSIPELGCGASDSPSRA